jgi:hypothetical protein
VSGRLRRAAALTNWPEDMPGCYAIKAKQLGDIWRYQSKSAKGQAGNDDSDVVAATYKLP